MIHCLVCILLGVDLIHINGDIIYWSLQKLSPSNVANTADAFFKKNKNHLVQPSALQEQELNAKYIKSKLMTAQPWRHGHCIIHCSPVHAQL